MRITTHQLRSAAVALLRHLDETGQSEFEINEDYYWFVPEQSVYQPYQEPKDLTLGQLSHDWNEVQALASGQREPLGHVLVWLASLLRRVGEKAIG